MADPLTRLNAVADDARRWHGVRGMLNGRPRRKPLRMDTLGDCIEQLEQYRAVLNRLEQATIVFSHHGEVVALLESIKDGYPLKTMALNNRLALSKGGWQ